MKKKVFSGLFFFLLFPFLSLASEADLNVPSMRESVFPKLGGVDGWNLLFYGLVFVIFGWVFGIWTYAKIKKISAHESMLHVSNIIYQTCKTYLIQQGKFLLILFGIIAVAIFYYFFGLSHMPLPKVFMVILWTIIGISGSYGVAWYGIRINTLANSRTTFAALKGRPWDVTSIPLRSGMSVGVLLVTIELFMMIFILLFIPRDSAGACFVGFAIGESLGASALRVAGGIFTKIADIGADLMKIVFNLPEDDPRNPGVIADCTGDNAGDSVGPTADGFETYGVTGVALIAFIVLAVVGTGFQANLIVWIFVIRIMMVITSLVSYWINDLYGRAKYGKAKDYNFEAPLTSLIWITSFVSIISTFIVSYFLLGGDIQLQNGVVLTGLWWKLSVIISLGTLAAALIPELTKSFTSPNSRHVKEIVTASREGGASLTILSGLVAGNFSAFWEGLTIVILMFVAYVISTLGLNGIMIYPTVFAFGLLAFGLLGMGPVTIAVDSFGPVTDNAQSVFELSRIEKRENIEKEIEEEFGFKPDFESGKYYLESNDAAGNTFKATAKPVLIGTAVIGATTMIFAIILLLKKLGLMQLQLLDPQVILGFITGGLVIYWFTGASLQAVTTGAYRATEFIKKHIHLDKTESSIEDSKSVVKICTKYAQNGMWNVFAVIFSFTLAFAFFDPNYFVSYLISLAVFGLFQAIYMANAGGAWDNAKKIVEVDLKEKGTPLHEATVVGDTVGDPYKDTSSVAMNPIIKFSTLFGLLAVEIAVHMRMNAHHAGTFDWTVVIGILLFIFGLIFAHKSFYGMRIKKGKE